MKLKLAIAGLLAIFVATGVNAEERAQTSVGNAEWKVRMQAMLTDVLVLFPYAFDESKFVDPKNAPAIETAMKSLVGHSAGLKKHTARFQPAKNMKIDPSFPFLGQAFENEITSAQVSFSGDPSKRTQSQGFLRSAISKCMMCHTQSANGPELKLDDFKSQFAALSASDRFLAFAATRQFDEALSEFGKYLDDSKITKPDPVTIDRQARTAIAIAVRVKKNPSRALVVIEQIKKSGVVSPMLQTASKDWKNSVLDWQSEKLAVTTSDKALFAEANRLSDLGKRRENSSGRFENSDIALLRASSLLHDLLSNFPASPLRAESYILLASLYDQLPGFAIWDLADEYLGACIQEYPHSSTGERCFSKYNDSMILGYSGSSGTHIPSAVQSHLRSMKELATRIEPKRPKR